MNAIVRRSPPAFSHAQHHWQVSWPFSQRRQISSYRVVHIYAYYCKIRDYIISSLSFQGCRKMMAVEPLFEQKAFNWDTTSRHIFTLWCLLFELLLLKPSSSILYATPVVAAARHLYSMCYSLHTPHSPHAQSLSLQGDQDIDEVPNQYPSLLYINIIYTSYNSISLPSLHFHLSLLVEPTASNFMWRISKRAKISQIQLTLLQYRFEEASATPRITPRIQPYFPWLMVSLPEEFTSRPSAFSHR